MNGRVAVMMVGLVALALGFGLGRQSTAPMEADVPAVAALNRAEMEQSMRATLAVDDQLERAEQMIVLLRALDAENAAGADAAFAEQVISVDRLDVRLFLSAWAAIDPKAALEHVLDWTLSSMRAFGAGEIVYTWALSGAGLEAYHYLRDVKESRVHYAAYERLLEGWLASGEHDGVTELIAGLEEGDRRDRFTEAVVSGALADSGVEGVIAWADAVPADSPNRFKWTAYRKALRQVSNRDPRRAASWYEEHADEEWGARMMPVVSSEWVEHDPLASLEWVRARDPSRWRDLAMMRLMNRWMRIDEERAFDWMLQVEYEPDLEPTVAPFVKRYARVDAAEAASWIDRIENAGERDQALLVVARAYGRQDPEGVEIWVASLDLPQQRRQLIAHIAAGGAPSPTMGSPGAQQAAGVVVE